MTGDEFLNKFQEEIKARGLTDSEIIEADVNEILRVVNVPILKQSQVGRAPSAEEIERGRSQQGGWTRKQLAAWGVPWPPPKGWKSRLIREHLRQNKTI